MSASSRSGGVEGLVVCNRKKEDHNDKEEG